MPRIADAFIDNAVYIYSTQEATEVGKEVGGADFSFTSRSGPRRVCNRPTS
jgi:hypothetical protein